YVFISLCFWCCIPFVLSKWSSFHVFPCILAYTVMVYRIFAGKSEKLSYYAAERIIRIFEANNYNFSV
ncbi:MAG TPA: hypothetical protein EYO82_05685, partial [Gammaproteobacteria bacterium]|nr:hypothetical protein [Gammaproteobacteria bacterium]